MRLRLKFFTLFLSAVFLIGSVSAVFEIGNLSHSIEKSYAPSEYIRGWINFSLNNELSTSKFKTDFGDSISLIDFLELNDANYVCNPLDCETNYRADGAGGNQKVFDLNNGDSEILGFKISGNFEDISGFSLDISSSAAGSTKPPLYIDILDDGINEWQAYSPSGGFGPETKGCYENGLAENVALITQTKYCENISIPASPNVKIGANVIKESGNGAVAFELSIYNENSEGFCEASASETGFVACVPDDFKIAEKQDFFVCISTLNPEDDGKYSINYEENNACGFSGVSSNKFDFNIFAQQGGYSPIGIFTLNNDEVEKSGIFEGEIEPYIKNYIRERFNNNCTSDCIIPIKFISGKDAQNMTLSNLDVSYDAGISRVTNKIYGIISEPAKIGSGFQKVNLDLVEFSVPGDFGEHEFSLELGEYRLFSEKINIEKVPSIISLTPRTTAAALPTIFKVNAVSNSGANISKYDWDFGDGKPETTAKNTFTHTFGSTGIFNVSVIVEDEDGLSSSKIFSIAVEAPIDAVKKSIERKLEFLKNINGQIDNFPLFYQDSLKSVLGLENMEAEATEIQKLYDSASTNENESYYIKLMERLTVLEIPKSVRASKSADSLSFYPKKENINLEILREIAGGNYSAGDEEKYINAVLAWNHENTKAKITFKELSEDYEDHSNVILNVFKIDTETFSGNTQYFILKKMQNVKFKEDYSERELSGYIYILLTDSKKTIEFSTTDDVDFFNLPLFISPEINKLQIIKGVSYEEEKLSKWVIFVLILILLLFLAFLAYIILHGWYKRKYENYLFKNRNDLYNLISYIENAKKKGLEENEMKKRLKKSGWNSEQINYVIKKYLGKRTGMFEIPIGKILNFFKKNDYNKPGSGAVPIRVK